MSKMREDAFVQCPYYRRDGFQAVYCEGVQDDCGLRMRFRDLEGLRKFKKLRCRDDWVGCPVAQMLNRLYAYEP